MQDLYTENYKTMLEEITNLNKWKDILFLSAERLNFVRMAILPE